MTSAARTTLTLVVLALALALALPAGASAARYGSHARAGHARQRRQAASALPDAGRPQDASRRGVRAAHSAGAEGDREGARLVDRGGGRRRGVFDVDVREDATTVADDWEPTLADRRCHLRIRSQADRGPRTVEAAVPLSGAGGDDDRLGRGSRVALWRRALRLSDSPARAGRCRPRPIPSIPTGRRRCGRCRRGSCGTSSLPRTPVAPATKTFMTALLVSFAL